MTSDVTNNTDDQRLGDAIVRLTDVDQHDVMERWWSSNSNDGTSDSPFDSDSAASVRLPRLVLFGFPFDEGCRRNGGRVGAAGGPTAVRKYLPRMGTLTNPEFSINLTACIQLFDAGDLPAQSTLELAHVELERRVTKLLSQPDLIPFVIGGSNDQSYCNAIALIRSRQQQRGIDSTEAGRIGVINIDAHLDVRPLKEPGGLAHSGSPFRQLLEDQRFHGRFVEFAAQGNQCSQVHAEYARSRNVDIHWLSALRRGDGSSDGESVAAQFERVLDGFGDVPIFVSFDLDAVCGADAPGVSATATIGLTAQEALDMCMIAGRHPRVRLFDLSEFNPAVDEYRTGRLVVNMFYWFAMGLAQRTSRKNAEAC